MSGVRGFLRRKPTDEPEHTPAPRDPGEPLRIAAITFCRDNQLPIIVFNVMEPGNIGRALTGEPIGTLVST